jgi:hypothetical protein
VGDGGTATGNYLRVRRSGEGVTDTPQRMEAKLALSQQEQKIRATKHSLLSYLKDYLPDNNSRLAAAKAIDDIAGRYDGRGKINALTGILSQHLDPYALGEAMDKAKQLQRDSTDLRSFRQAAEERPEYGGSRLPSYGDEYKMQGSGSDDSALGHYVTTFNQPSAPYGGRKGSVSQHYSAPQDEFINTHSRLSRRPVLGSEFEKLGVGYDETTTHLDEDQSDLFQKNTEAVGRELTDAELEKVEALSVQYDELDARMKDAREARRRMESWIDNAKHNAKHNPINEASRGNREHEVELSARSYPEYFPEGVKDFNERSAIDQMEDAKSIAEGVRFDIRQQRDAIGRDMGNIESVTQSKMPDAIMKEKKERRVNAILEAIYGAIQRGDENVTISSPRQQAMAYDQWDYVEDVVYDPEQGGFVEPEAVGEQYNERIIADSELERLGYSPEDIKRYKEDVLSKEDFYKAEREFYVENDADNIVYDAEPAERYRDKWGDLHEDLDDALEEGETIKDVEIARGYEYNEEFYESDKGINEWAYDRANEAFPEDVREIEHHFEMMGEIDPYTNYLENGNTINIGEEVGTHPDVAGTMKWYTDDYNEGAIRDVYDLLGVKQPETIFYLDIPTSGSYMSDSPDSVASIPITPELIRAMDDAPMFGRFQEKGKGWKQRHEESWQRRSKMWASQYWLDEVELYSSYPRSTRKDVDPRPEMQRVQDTVERLWPKLEVDETYSVMEEGLE